MLKMNNFNSTERLSLYYQERELLKKSLKDANIKTWFDLGLFLDKIKLKQQENLRNQVQERKENQSLSNDLLKKRIAFLTFEYCIDGVCIEISKYVKAFEKIYKEVNFHFIGFNFSRQTDNLLETKLSSKKHIIFNHGSFDEWASYNDFFFKKMNRGDESYNQLIKNFWQETLDIIEQLLDIFENNGIDLMYLVNVGSNPGNISLMLAYVIVSEYLEVQTINNCHDFYFENGSSKNQRLNKNQVKGHRDFFYTNSHIGEVFSIIETLFPWQSPLWTTLNINQKQTEIVTKEKGHNISNVTNISTTIDLQIYRKLSREDNKRSLIGLEELLKNGKNKVEIINLEKFYEEYNLNKLLKNRLSMDPIIFGKDNKKVEKFCKHQLIFLQPTRIIKRKNIQLNFKILKKFFQHSLFVDRLLEEKELTVNLIITGPIAKENKDYFLQVIQEFNELLKDLPKEFSEKVFLTFLFSAFDRSNKQENIYKLDLVKLYNISSLVFLLSDIEGRGLPIIESSACEVPIMCKRYSPESVYKDVIGEHLQKDKRIIVFEISNSIEDDLIDKVITTIFNKNLLKQMTEINRIAVNNRYNLNVLVKDIKYVLKIFDLQFSLKQIAVKKVSNIVQDYVSIIDKKCEDFEELFQGKSKSYLAGYGKLGFMIYLKSLIDPSFFRIEEQQIKGLCFKIAKKILEEEKEHINYCLEKEVLFYVLVESLFCLKEEKDFAIKHDHSLAYRYRNDIKLCYYRFTFQEITSLIRLIFNDTFFSQRLKREKETSVSIFENIVSEEKENKSISSERFLQTLTNSKSLEIDDRKRLLWYLKTSLPLGYFISNDFRKEVEFFIFERIKICLRFKNNENITEEIIEKYKLTTTYLFVANEEMFSYATSKEIFEYFEKKSLPYKKLYKNGCIKIIKTNQLSIGIHFKELSKESLKALKEIKENRGFLILPNEHSLIMSDYLNIDRFHIGQVTEIISSKMLGINLEAGFILFVIGGTRGCLSYPTPIQTFKDYYKVLNSFLFEELSKKISYEKLLEEIKIANKKGDTPIIKVLQDLENKYQSNIQENKIEEKEDLNYNYISGVYKDKMPWNGVSIKLNSKNNYLNFYAYHVNKDPKNVQYLVEDFLKEHKELTAKVAWNGGFILNPELVGKLSLTENYIGSPLGLLVIDKKICSFPLFNKPSLLFFENGLIDIKTISLKNGFSLNNIIGEKKSLVFTKENYGCNEENQLGFFDLYKDKKVIKGNGNIIVRISGNYIKEIIKTKKDEIIDIKPIGVTLVIPPHLFPKEWNKVEQEMNLFMEELQTVKYAIEAGPLLVKEGKFAINMEEEGWTTEHSINTQAARMDYLNMRGPKIAAGITKSNELFVVAINGRIRESVGATHIDVANILQDLGVEKAMGFDPGGSSTLWVKGKFVNISPYNKEYEQDIYSLPPEPRFVSNVIIGC